MTESRAWIVWECLFAPGTEHCVMRAADGRRLLDGTAVLMEREEPVSMTYSVECDADWTFLSAKLSGHVAGRDMSLAVVRAAGGTWSVNGTPTPELDHALDIDLGFTPSTNTCAIRRMNLDVGQEMPATVSWLDTADWTFKPLRQAYLREDRETYLYRSPDNEYEARIQANGIGWVTSYPDLWRVVATG